MKSSKNSCEPKDVLCCAFEEFADWAKAELEKEQEAGKIVLPIYHYTDLGGLKGILENRQIWFTHYQYLNDPAEFVFGVRLAREAVNKIVKENEENQRLAQFFNVLVTMCEDDNFDKILALYTASFCRSADDLGQWRSYSDNGRGFAIGLHPKLFNSGDKITPLKPPEVIGHVCYGPNCNRIGLLLQKAAEIFLGVDPCQMGIRPFSDDDKEFMQEFSRRIWATSLIYYSLTSKHDEYAIEKEVRLLILNTTDIIRDNIKTRVRGTLLVPYIPHPISIDQPDMIHEIVIGPAADKQMEKSLEFLLNEFGYRQEIKIRRSDIPFGAI